MKIFLTLLAVLFAVHFSYAQTTTISVPADGTYVVASGSRIKGTYTLSIDAPNRVQTAVLLINANQYDVGSTLSVLSDHSYVNNVVMSNFRIVFNSDLSIVYLLFDIANRNGATSLTANFNGTGAYDANWGGSLPASPVSAGLYPLCINNGNVGIGTINPNGYKLAVNGTIHAKEIKVNLDNWADYVFKPTYQLKPLSEVKAYIAQNQHLPEMPSAAEVEKDGVNLGEMVKLQTKKIEELTLYLIEQNKENKMQQLQLFRQERLIRRLQNKVKGLNYRK